MKTKEQIEEEIKLIDTERVRLGKDLGDSQLMYGQGFKDGLYWVLKHGIK